MSVYEPGSNIGTAEWWGGGGGFSPTRAYPCKTEAGAGRTYSMTRSAVCFPNPCVATPPARALSGGHYKIALWVAFVSTICFFSTGGAI